MDDAEARGLLRDDRDVTGAGTGAGDGVGHASVQSGLREGTDIEGSRAGGRACKHHRIAAKRTGVGADRKNAKRGDVEVHVVAGNGDTGRGGLDDGDVYAGGSGRGSSQGDGVAG